MTTTNPFATATSWVEGATGSLYDLDNLPYGIFSDRDTTRKIGVRIGDFVLDVTAAAQATNQPFADVLDSDRLNDFMASGKDVWHQVRTWLTTLLSDESRAAVVVLRPLTDVTLHLPFEVADYVDYYASMDHATNVGKMFRPDGDALMPNWRHLPVGYHGRAGSIVVSGTDIHRPAGQRKAPDQPAPTFGPCQRLDIEAELGFVVGRAVPFGERVGTDEFADTVFGVCGVNDWSARDIQSWEYVPLGPNLAKSFATSISAWITPLDALATAKVPTPEQEPEVVSYLVENPPMGYDIAVEVELNGEVVSQPPYAAMYWSPAQMLAHMTVNGASLRVGDFFASGTISGPEKQQCGSFLELSWGGSEPFTASGQTRTFLEDGDEVVLRYTAPGARRRIALGEVRGKILHTI
ncbi:MAG: fumarylacetoacetase [Nocardioides sp.]|uniref:fumarylacetoacetase n=1 Tax=Nocardioides sp. TaxID=35761 RepID=UPI0039E5B1C7